MNRKRGTSMALLASLLFGVGTPLIKLRFSGVDPLLLAGLIAIGSGLGVAVLTRFTWRPGELMKSSNLLFFAIATLVGGIAAPVLLIWGIAHAPGSAAALLLNLEAAFTAFIAWIVFRDHIGPRVMIGLTLVTAGSIVVSANEGSGTADIAGSVSIAASCLCWAIDNNCTARLRNVTSAQFTVWKGILSGCVLLLTASLTKTALPATHTIFEALLLGTCCYGLALLSFFIALQILGAGRTSAYFATAPFVGAATAVWLLDDPITARLIFAALLMAGGVVALFTEPHLRTELGEQRVDI